MPASTLRWFRSPRLTGTLWVRPDKGDWLESLSLRTATDFLALPGVVVSGHVRRNVSRVDLGGTTAYLKREHRVRLRDRFRSWRDGFGWASVSVREAAVLRRLEKHGLSVPAPLAFGEAHGQGFLLLESADNHVDLRSLGPMDDDLGERLGRVIARVHAAGVDQPDLFAKHVLVNPADHTIKILDWQRAVIRRSVPGARRARGLAALRASAPEGLFPDAAWDRLLDSYCQESGRSGLTGRDHEWFRRTVDGLSARLAGRPGMRSQRMMAGPIRQELVRIRGETVCTIPDVAARFESESAIAGLYDMANDGRLISLPDGRVGHLRVRHYVLPFDRWWAALRGRAWRSPELKDARLLFHFERHGIPAPKLLAYGQTVRPVGPARAFVLSEPTVTRPVELVHAAAVRELLDRLHAVGCRLNGADGVPFVAAGGRVMVRDADEFRLVKRVARRQAERDRARIDEFMRGPR